MMPMVMVSGMYVIDSAEVVVAAALSACLLKVTQHIQIVDEMDKRRKLFNILEKVYKGGKVLVFCSTKRTCDSVTRHLREAGWPARAIHGDKSQQERDWVLQEFRDGKAPIMVATDVASRGLGKPNKHVCMATDRRDVRVVFCAMLNHEFCSALCRH